MIRIIDEELREASAGGDETKAQLLLGQGANVNSANCVNGWTALHWAAYRGHRGLVMFLLNKGADPTIKNKKGETVMNLLSEYSLDLLEGKEVEEASQYPLLSEKDTLSSLPIVPNYIKNPQFPHNKGRDSTTMDAIGQLQNIQRQKEQEDRSTSSSPKLAPTLPAAAPTVTTVSQGVAIAGPTGQQNVTPRDNQGLPEAVPIVTLRERDNARAAPRFVVAHHNTATNHAAYTHHPGVNPAQLTLTQRHPIQIQYPTGVRPAAAAGHVQHHPQQHPGAPQHQPQQHPGAPQHHGVPQPCISHHGVPHHHPGVVPGPHYPGLSSEYPIHRVMRGMGPVSAPGWGYPGGPQPFHPHFLVQPGMIQSPGPPVGSAVAPPMSPAPPATSGPLSHQLSSLPDGTQDTDFTTPVKASPVSPGSAISITSSPSTDATIKVRAAGSEDFFEVELGDIGETYTSLVTCFAEELDVERGKVGKIRKLPNILIRKDRDVKRIKSGSEFEVEIIE